MDLSQLFWCAVVAEEVSALFAHRNGKSDGKVRNAAELQNRRDVARDVVDVICHKV